MSAFRWTRRDALKGSLAALAATGVPRWFVEEQTAQLRAADERSPNERPRLALIGCGGRGSGVAKDAQRFGDVVAVCDVDAQHRDRAREAFGAEAAHSDFRHVCDLPNVDVIINGTPDHWHTLVNLRAVRSGKDVYSEKPLTLTIDEGKRLVAAVRESGRILQTGSQQRSDARFRLACELVRNGRIGKVHRATAWLPMGLHEGPFQAASVPDGLDWDFWLGQTPEVPYVPERCHRTFRYWYEYSGGTMTDWGAHHNDIALWGLGLERSGPVTVEGRTLVEPIPGGFTAASQYRVRYTYANGVEHLCNSTTANQWNGAKAGEPGPEEMYHGVKFEGSDGWIFVTRGEIQASDRGLLEQELPASATLLPVSNDHTANLFESVRTRAQPICDVEIGHRSASVCHLGVIAIRLGRKLAWDPQRESFVGDAEAQGMVAREMRKPWTYDAV
jgi:predicted dehydrogenase